MCISNQNSSLMIDEDTPALIGIDDEDIPALIGIDDDDEEDIPALIGIDDEDIPALEEVTQVPPFRTACHSFLDTNDIVIHIDFSALYEYRNEKRSSCTQ